MRSQRDALLLGFGDTIVDHDVSGIELDLDFAAGFADLNPSASPGVGNRVPVGMQSDIAFDVDDAFVKTVDLRNPGRQWLQARLFQGKQFAGNGVKVFLVSGVDAIAPLTRLPIQIFPGGEGAAGEEVVFDEVERTLDSGGTDRKSVV